MIADASSWLTLGLLSLVLLIIIGHVQGKNFRNRNELDAFLVYPMLWFLEYPEQACSLAHPVTMMGGANGPPAFAGCLVFDITGIVRRWQQRRRLTC